MKKSKKILSLFCAIAMLISMLTIPASSTSYRYAYPEGDYIIASAADPNYVLDLSGGGTATYTYFQLKYTINEKITIMQKLVDFEADCLGIPTIPITTELLSGFTLGQYSNEAKEIWIDIEHFAKSPIEECIQTICHEIFHSYQHYLVDNLDWDSNMLQCSYFTELHVWKENQENYRSVWTSGYDAYESQPLEVTARSYAEQETEKILSYIS